MDCCCQKPDLGLGYSGPSIVDGRICIMDTRDNEESLICLDETSGETLWSIPVGGKKETEQRRYRICRRQAILSGGKERNGRK